MLHHIAYVSLSRLPLDGDTLDDIMEISKKNNARDGITGVLMYHDDLFFQVLEGKAPVVQQCFKRVRRDERHSNISESLDETVEVRSFSQWLMGYVGPDEIGKYTNGALRSLDGLHAPELTPDVRRGHALALARQVFKGFSER